MNIEIAPEEQLLLETMVSEGQFSSIAEAITASVKLLKDQAEWTKYAKDRIEAGMDAVERNDFASEEEMDELFERYRLKSA